MAIENTRITIITQKGETMDIELEKGVRQGDALSMNLFNMALEYVLRNVNKGALRTGGRQVVGYARRNNN